jgi:hypothetical protein
VREGERPVRKRGSEGKRPMRERMEGSERG